MSAAGELLDREPLHELQVASLGPLLRPALTASSLGSLARARPETRPDGTSGAVGDQVSTGLRGPVSSGR